MSKHTTTQTLDANSLPGTQSGETLADSEARVDSAIMTDIDNHVEPGDTEGSVTLKAEYDGLAAQDPAWAKSEDAKINAEFDKVNKG